MQVKDVMTSGFETINSSADLTQAAKKMKALDVGVLPVMEDDKIVGMITDRDMVIRALAENRDAGSVIVREVMSEHVTYCSFSDTIEEAANIMRDKQVRRLIVLDEDNTAVGIISLGDIAARAHLEELAGVILEGVSEPSHSSR
jgi:CBS domain-containing protein